MIVTIAKVADFDQFLKTFSTKGAEKRKQHGCAGSHVFRDPEDPNRVWVFFDWKLEDYESFLARERRTLRQAANWRNAARGPGRGRNGGATERERRRESILLGTALRRTDDQRHLLIASAPPARLGSRTRHVWPSPAT